MRQIIVFPLFAIGGGYARHLLSGREALRISTPLGSQKNRLAYSQAVRTASAHESLLPKERF